MAAGLADLPIKVGESLTVPITPGAWSACSSRVYATAVRAVA